MKKILLGLIIATGLFASWQMQSDSMGVTYIYNTETGRVFFCQKNNTFSDNKKTYDMADNPSCKDVMFLSSEMSKEGKILPKMGLLPQE